jgi:tetratricopeptide (TPR) repeat protein
MWLAPAFYIRAFAPEKKAADRYLYLPSVGFCILVAAGIRRIRVSDRELFGVPAGQGAAALALFVTLSGASLAQEMNWSSDVVMFYRATQIAPNNDVAKEDLAIALMAQGHYDRAVPLLEQVMQHKPNRWAVLDYLGVAHYYLGNYQHAIDYLTRAIEVNDSNAQEYAYLGLSQLKLGQRAPAAGNFQVALRLKPDQEDCHFGLGLILEQQGQLQEAVHEYEAELKLQPTNEALRKHMNEVQARLSSQSATKQPVPSREHPRL